MKMPSHNPQYSKVRQQGTTAIEFALIAMIFLTLLLGIMEFGRVFYIWNSVQEVTRRAAREAVVRDFNTDLDVVRRAAVFQRGSGAAYLPGGPEVSSVVVQINYLNGNLAPASPMPLDPADNMSACNDVNRTSSCIQYVEACVANDGSCADSVTYHPMISLFPFLEIDIPVSRVLMPAESLGFNVSP